MKGGFAEIVGIIPRGIRLGNDNLIDNIITWVDWTKYFWNGKECLQVCEMRYYIIDYFSSEQLYSKVR